MTPRYFTVAEVNRLLPRLRPAVEKVREGSRRLADLGESLFPEGQPVCDTVVDQDYLGAVQALSEALAAVGSLGGQMKDLRMGLVDFPSLLEGREVLLCWMPGEDAVRYWHDLHAGFKGRAAIENETDFHGDPGAQTG